MQWLKTIVIALNLLALVTFAILLRLIYVMTSGSPILEERKDGTTCSIAIFLGSGGHTSEMMQLIKALPLDRYTSRTYVLTTNDRFSMNKALEFEKSILTSSKREKTTSSPQFSFVYLPRARNVHQAWITTPISVLLAFMKSVQRFVLQEAYFKSSCQADCVIMNGPGTCVPIVASIYVLRILGKKSPRIIFVESFARVSSLSLTAKVLSRFVDRFVVQWPKAATNGADYRGYLV